MKVRLQRGISYTTKVEDGVGMPVTKDKYLSNVSCWKRLVDERVKYMRKINS